MLSRIYISFIALFFFVNTTPDSATLTVERGADLQLIINYANDNDTIIVGLKTFQAKSKSFKEPLCGNCLETKTEVKATYGFIIRDKSLVIIGKDRDESRLVTNAGYGVYIVNSPSSKIINLTITGGKRDPDGNATDG